MLAMSLGDLENELHQAQQNVAFLTCAKDPKLGAQRKSPTFCPIYHMMFIHRVNVQIFLAGGGVRGRGQMQGVAEGKS